MSTKTAATRTLTVAQMRAEARARYGPDIRTWAYQCPACGHVATGPDIVEFIAKNPAALLGVHGTPIDAGQALAQHCINCFAAACDAGTTVVTTPEGQNIRIFELAPTP